jgi:nitroreductase
MSSQSVALVGVQLLLAAHAEGLGGDWICWPLFAPGETIYVLGPDPEWEPQVMIFLGYPAEKPEMQAGKPLIKITRYL